MSDGSGRYENGSPVGNRMKPGNVADVKWGYQFSVDGLMDADVAETFLADISRTTLQLQIKAGLVAAGRDNGRTVLCRYPVVEYAANLDR